MASSGHDRNAAENRLLAALPSVERERLTSRMERIELGIKAVLWQPEQPIEHVYFPVSGVISLVAVMEDGLAAEVATVGNEGFLGVPVFLGARDTPLKAFSQVPGASLRMPIGVFAEEVAKGGPLNAVLHRYTQALFVQISQSAACNRLHSIEERCARWLLMTHDRVHSDEFPLTQEFLAQMLGVRRASVNMVAGMLQQAGLIRYSRGRITVLDRAGLEQVACECYQVVRQEYERLTGAGATEGGKP